MSDVTKFPYKAVMFDAADTLLQAPSAVSELQHFLAERNFHMEYDVVDQVVRSAIDTHYYGKKRDFHAVCSPESDRAFWVELYNTMFRHFDVQPQFHMAWSNALYDRFTSAAPYTLFDDVIPTLQKLQQLGVQVGVISNFAPTLKHIFFELGLDVSQFNVCIVSTEVGLEKPNPAIFNLALAQTGLQAEDVLYVGDHPINDVEAPLLVGMDAVRIKRYGYLKGDGITQFSSLFLSDIPYLRKGKRS
jgi:putative hydrolase of the HAD superfamily